MGKCHVLDTCFKYYVSNVLILLNVFSISMSAITEGFQGSLTLFITSLTYNDNLGTSTFFWIWLHSRDLSI